MKYLNFDEMNKFVFARYGDRAICIKLDYNNIFIPEDVDDQEYIKNSEEIVLYTFPQIYSDAEIFYDDLVLVQAETLDSDISKFARLGFDIYLPTGCDVWERVNTFRSSRDIPRFPLSKLKDLHPLQPEFEGAMNTITLMDPVVNKENVLVLPVTSEASRQGIPHRCEYSRDEVDILCRCCRVDVNEDVDILSEVFDTLESTSPKDCNYPNNLLDTIASYTELNQIDELEDQDETMILLYGLRKILENFINFRVTDETTDEYISKWVDMFENLSWAHFYFQRLYETCSEFDNYCDCILKDYWENEYAGQ